MCTHVEKEEEEPDVVLQSWIDFRPLSLFGVWRQRTWKTVGGSNFERIFNTIFFFIIIIIIIYLFMIIILGRLLLSSISSPSIDDLTLFRPSDE